MDGILNHLWVLVKFGKWHGLWFTVHAGHMVEWVFAYLVDIKEEYREVKEDDDEERQDEDYGQRGEHPEQVLQNTQIVIQLTKACPFLPCMKHTHLWTKTDRSAIRSVIRSTTLVQTETSLQLLDGLSWNFVQTFMFARGWILMTLVIPWLFL